MVAVTLRAAKARLNELVDRALEGEEVVLKKGARQVALRPIHEDDDYTLTDAQAQKITETIARERAEGRIRSFSSPEKAVDFLRREFDKPAGRKSRTGK